MRVGGQRHAPVVQLRELYTRLGGQAWTGAENLAPTGIRSLDCATRSESLYRLSYHGPQSIKSILCKSINVIQYMSAQSIYFR